jgi:hypothetical protein
VSAPEVAVHVQDGEVVLEAHGEFVFMSPETAFWLARELVEAMQRVTS